MNAGIPGGNTEQGIESQRLAKNVHKTLVLAFFQVFLVLMPVIVPFFESRGLTMSDIFALQAVFALVVVIMEVPSGYAADLLGRKQTLVVGSIFIALGHSVLPFADGFAMLALFEICLGVGSSLVSGADLALLYDTEVAIARQHEAPRAVASLFGARQVSEAVAAICCSVLLLWSMDAAMWAQVITGWIPLVVAFTLVEPPGERLEGGQHALHLSAIFRLLLRSDAVLRYTFLALAIWSLTTFYAVWLLQRLWQDQALSLEMFGYLWAGYAVMSALAGRYAAALERWLGASWLLLLIGVLPLVGYVGLVQFGVVGGLIAASTFYVARGAGLVMLRDALNVRVPARYRATANSVASFAFRLTFAVTGPPVGWVLDLWGMATTLWLLAFATLLILLAVILPLILAERAGRPKPEANPA